MSKTVKDVKNMRTPGGRSFIKKSTTPYIGTINRVSEVKNVKRYGGSGLDGGTLNSITLE